MRMTTVILTNCLHGSERVSLVCESAALWSFTVFVKRRPTISASYLCRIFLAILRNYNGTSARQRTSVVGLYRLQLFSYY